MTAGSVERAPTLVLGLGNLLLEDDAVGLKLLEAIAADDGLDDTAEFVDGGTQGLGLLRYLAGRKRVVILDAIGLGATPGTVHVLRGAEVERLHVHRASTAHEGNALELLAVARLLGDLPEEVSIVGIEPEHVRTGIGVSPIVASALPQAAIEAARIIRSGHVPRYSR